MIYAAWEGVRISGMTATPVCAGMPEKLLKTLEEGFDYEIFGKVRGDLLYF